MTITADDARETWRRAGGRWDLTNPPFLRAAVLRPMSFRDFKFDGPEATVEFDICTFVVDCVWSDGRRRLVRVVEKTTGTEVARAVL